MRAALYSRVSTQHKGQETANQLLQLRECCQAQHWSVLQEYEDHESGGKSERTAFQQMLRDAAARSFDVLFFWSLDRLTREEPWPLSNTWNCWRVTAFVGAASPNRGLIVLALSVMSSSACWPVSPSKNEFGSQNEFVLGSRGRGSMEHAAEGPLAGRDRCSIEIGSLSFEGRDSLGARSPK